MKYFGYDVALTHLVGDDPKQIIRTLEYYKDFRGADIAIPSESEIRELPKVRVECAFPMMNPSHVVEARLEENVSFLVNANAFVYIQALSLGYEILKRGDLYKFYPGITSFGLYFLPESIMKGLQDYNWSQHASQVEEWLSARESILNDLQNAGHIVRVREAPKKKPDYSKN